MPVPPTLSKHPIYVLVLSDLHFGKAKPDLSAAWYEVFLKAVKGSMRDKELIEEASIDMKDEKKKMRYSRKTVNKPSPPPPAARNLGRSLSYSVSIEQITD